MTIDSPEGEEMRALQQAQMLQAISDAVDWYDAVGPAEAVRRVAIDRSALLWRYDTNSLCAGSA